MSRSILRWLTTLIFHLYLCDWAQSLRGVRLDVPEAVLTGDTARLACDYDLEQAALYSIKWYRGDEEFYRFVPKESPPTRVFPLPGIHVDISLSDARKVTLLDVQKQLTGFYKCEVSADAPLFHTEIKSASMTVVDVPPEEPTLTVDKYRYSAGEQIQANCTSRASYPAANLTWFVNGQQVPGPAPTVIFPEPGGSLETSRSTLELEADSATFRDTKLRLRCEASLFKLYRRSSEELELHEDTPQLASVLGPSIADSSIRLDASFSMVFAILCILLMAACR
ncbi:CD166 antigen-like isoform X2 [Periplaneta americana]|uniref:CD166 antigen-like isoform X2 n=1 Tax=Periplaneta americana TaxID=6978 RepID=UPI0037E8B7A4